MSCTEMWETTIPHLPAGKEQGRYVQREKTKGKGAGVTKLRLACLHSGSAWFLTASGTGTGHGSELP